MTSSSVPRLDVQDTAHDCVRLWCQSVTLNLRCGGGRPDAPASTEADCLPNGTSNMMPLNVLRSFCPSCGTPESRSVFFFFFSVVRAANHDVNDDPSEAPSQTPRRCPLFQPHPTGCRLESTNGRSSSHSSRISFWYLWTLVSSLPLLSVEVTAVYPTYAGILFACTGRQRTPARRAVESAYACAASLSHN